MFCSVLFIFAPDQNHLTNRMFSSEYLQEVLLVMLASKPVLVSAKRSDKGKFSKNNKNRNIHVHQFTRLFRTSL